jgi:hypothetical protein
MDTITKGFDNFKEGLSDVGDNIMKKADEGKAELSKDSSKDSSSTTKEKFNFSNFMESNSLVAKFAFLLLVIFVFIVLLGICINLISSIFDNTIKQKVINGMINASTQMLTVTQDPNISGSKTIYRSNNMTSGIEFTWSVWIYINDIGSNDKYQHVFSKGNYAPNNIGLNYPNNAPGLYLYPNQNSLCVIMDTFEVVGEEVNIPDIPMNKWVNVIIICRNKYLDVYINGVITKSVELIGVPKQNYGDVYVAMNGGFNGYISNLWYYSYSLGTVAVEDLVKKGPNTNMTDNSTINGKDFDYLSLRWYFFGTNSEYFP